MKLFSKHKRFCRRRHRPLSVLTLLPGITSVFSLATLGNSRGHQLYPTIAGEGTFKHPGVPQWLNSPQFNFPSIFTFRFWLYIIVRECRNLAAQRVRFKVSEQIGERFDATIRTSWMYQYWWQSFTWVAQVPPHPCQSVKYAGYLLRRNLIAQDLCSY